MTTHRTHTLQGANALASFEISEAEALERANRARAEAIANALAGLFRWLGRRLKAPFRHGSERQRIINELNSLDDRMLSDIGITRGDIPFVASGGSRLGHPRNDSGAKAA